MGNYDRLWEWIYQNYDIGNYFSAQELLYDVENRFVKDGHYFPEGARDLVKERFQYQREYREMQRREDEQKKIAEYIGGGQVYESLSDQILEDMRKPEIMGIDVSEYSTTKESVIPPDIEKFAYKQPNFFRKIASRFVGFFRRR